jgi:hypothetical protein
MEFTKRLREGVRRGDITCSVRIWMRPHVKRGNRYRMGEGEIEVDAIDAIELADITPELARASGFASVVELLKIAKHGPGTNVYLVRFHYVPAGVPASASRARPRAASSPPRKKANSDRQRKRIVRIVETLPEASAVARDGHLSLEVRKKRFGYFLDDHHGDGRIALSCRAAEDLRDMLRERMAEQFHIPKYVGNRGWIGLWLDTANIDWSLVELALRDAYLQVAPKPRARVNDRRASPRAHGKLKRSKKSELI